MKRSFFQAAVLSILLYGCTTWMLTKWLEKKLDGNYTRMLRAILNKFWRQHPTRHQLYGHLLPITKTTQVKRARHAGHCWRSRDELIRDVLLWTPHMAGHTFSSYVRIGDIVLKTCQRRWRVGKSGERVSGISVLVARQDDDRSHSYRWAAVVPRSNWWSWTLSRVSHRSRTGITYVPHAASHVYVKKKKERKKRWGDFLYR